MNDIYGLRPGSKNNRIYITKQEGCQLQPRFTCNYKWNIPRELNDVVRMSVTSRVYPISTQSSSAHGDARSPKPVITGVENVVYKPQPAREALVRSEIHLRPF